MSGTFETPPWLLITLLQLLCAVPPKLPQRNIHADLQLCHDMVAFSSQRISREDLGIELVVSSFPLLHFFLMTISTSVRKACACADETPKKKKKKLGTSK